MATTAGWADHRVLDTRRSRVARSPPTGRSEPCAPHAVRRVHRGGCASRRWPSSRSWRPCLRPAAARGAAHRRARLAPTALVDVRHVAPADRRDGDRPFRADRREHGSEPAEPRPPGELMGRRHRAGGRQRLLASSPRRARDRGHVANAAFGGTARPSVCPGTVRSSDPPHPAACHRPDHRQRHPLRRDRRGDITKFGEAVQAGSGVDHDHCIAGLQDLRGRSAGRPSPAFVTDSRPSSRAKPALTGSGICDFYDEKGNIIQRNFDSLTTIIDGYETEETSVCAAVPELPTDGGVRAAHVRQHRELYR